MRHRNDLLWGAGKDDGRPASPSAPAAAPQARLFIFSRGASTPCTIAGIAGSDLEVSCRYEGPPGTVATIFLENFGALTGTILDRERNSLRFRCSAGDSWNMPLLVNLPQFISSGGKIRSRTERADIAFFPTGENFIRANGESASFELTRISAHGLSVKSAVQPPVGEFLNFGIFFARVSRWHESGFEAQFLDNI